MVLIRNGNVHNGLGKVECTDILIDGGIIKEMGKNISCAEAEVIDAAGHEILPGFIDSLNIYGCRGPGWGDNDATEYTDPVLPQMNALHGFDPSGMCFQKLYRYGITSAGISPASGNVLGGQAAVFHTWGNNPLSMMVKEKAVMVASVSSATKKPYASRNMAPMTKMGAFALLTEALRKAEKYNGEIYDAKCEALKPVVNGEMLLLINCLSNADIEGIEMAMKPFCKIKWGLSGAYGLNSINSAKLFKNHPVMLGNMTNGMEAEADKVDFEAVVSLMEDDNPIAIACCGDRSASGKESLLWNALIWHRNGLDSELALRAITSIPAKILGVDDKIGSLKPGMVADLSIWTGNPIETYLAKQTKVFIAGEDVLAKEGDALCW